MNISIALPARKFALSRYAHCYLEQSPVHSQKTPWRRLAKQIADEYGLSVDDLLSYRRTRRIVHARQHLMALMRAQGRSYAHIGRLLARQKGDGEGAPFDHTTVRHACLEHAKRAGL